MTYYKYAERSVDTQINWAEVGKSMSDTIQAEIKSREEKKAAIDQASREFGEVLANAPTGDYDAGNTFTLDFANNTQEFRLMQDRLLKSGQLSLKDYTIGRQNINDGTNNLFSLAEEYQKEYTEKMTRWEGDESSFREVWEMEQAEGLANLRNSRGYINPTNGTVTVGKMVKNPDSGVMELSKNPNDAVTVNELRNRLKQKYDRYDLNEAAAARVSKLGEIENAIVKYAGEGALNVIITEIDAKDGKYALDEDAKQFAADYKAWEDLQVGSMMSVPTHITSVLTDMKLAAPNGEDYTFTYSKEEFDAQGEDGNLIYLDRSENAAGEPVFKERQREAVEQSMRVALRAQIDVKKQAKAAGTTQYKPVANVNADKALKEEGEIVSTIGKLYYGDKNTGTSALSFLSGLDRNKDFYKMTRDTNGVQLFYTDENGDEAITTLSFRDSNGDIMSQEDFIISASSKLGGVTNVKEALSKSGYKKDAKFFGLDATEDNMADFSYEVAEERTQKLGFDQAFEQNEGAKLDPQIVLADAGAAITDEQEAAAVQALEGMVASIPGADDVSIRDYNFGTGQGIVIEIGTGKDRQRFEIDLDEETEDAAAKRTQAFEDAKKAIIAHAMESERFIRDEKQRQEYVDQFGTKRPGGGSMSNF